jgi:hypothetical protein
MKKGERSERLQVDLSETEHAAIHDFQFRNRIPTKAAAIRELLRRGLAASETEPPEHSH